MAERLQKLIAAAGLCSRRTAEEWIEEGRVYLNGERAVIGQRADLSHDIVLVDGKPLVSTEKKRYLMLNKPRGYVCTLSDEKGRPTVSDLVRDCGTRVFPVGRLDLDSDGLLLLTNDGEWMQRILHPKYEVNKTYRVSVAGEISGAAERLSSLREIDGEPIARADVQLLHHGRETAELLFTIHQGKNRQIRRMCGSVGLHVRRLQRIAEHHLLLGDLPEGSWRDLTTDEIQSFQ